MKSYKKILFAGALWGVSLTALSWVSGYSIRGSVGVVDIEIATMLTPAGMAHIFSAHEHWLRPYYTQLTRETGGFTAGGVIVASYLVFAGFSLLLLKLFRRGRNDLV